jgi:Uracil DNA glycosylase superfamily
VEGFARLVDDLAAATIGDTFNFLRDDDPELDVAGGAAIRRENLLRYLEERGGAEVVAVGEAGGYQGARWSGIAFTSERTLAGWGEPWARTSRRPRIWSEPSATIVHGVLDELDAERRVLLWNAVPTHPHPPGAPLLNRRPRTGEQAAGIAYAGRLLEIVKPRIVVAIGRIAETALTTALTCDVVHVRHPANGGAAGFAEGMRGALGQAAGRTGAPG